MNPPLHKAQLHILDALRRTESQSFSQLMKPLAMQSDAFKFHLRKVCDLGLVIKNPTGTYSLTTAGKETANRLSRTSRITRNMPKLSMILVLRRTDANGQTEYLCQKRLRQPFYGFWGCLSGPVLWGEELEDAAMRELYKQTGLRATFTAVSFFRQRDYTTSNMLLEDKLFAVMSAHITHDEKLTHDWTGGHNQWLSLAALTSKQHHFASSLIAIKALSQKSPYTSHVTHYDTTNY